MMNKPVLVNGGRRIMGEYKTLADIPYEVLLERAVFILCKKIDPSDPYKIKMEAYDQAVNELTGVKNEN